MKYVKPFNEFFSASLMLSTASAIILFKIIYSIITKKSIKQKLLDNEIELKKTNDSIVSNVLDTIKNLTFIGKKYSNIFEITEDENTYILTQGSNLRTKFPIIKVNKTQKLLTYNDHDISLNDEQYNEILSVINGYM